MFHNVTARGIELEIVPDLNFLLAPILAIAKVATMVGLLGTVISMVNTFNKIQEAVKNNEPATGQAGDSGTSVSITW